MYGIRCNLNKEKWGAVIKKFQVFSHTDRLSIWSGKTKDIDGLQKNWKERVQPRAQTPSCTCCSSITTSQPDFGDNQNDQEATKVIPNLKKHHHLAKVNMPDQGNHQEGTKTVLFHTILISYCVNQTLMNFSQG